LVVGVVGAFGIWLTLGFALPGGIRLTFLVSDLMDLPVRLVFCASFVVFAYGAWHLKPWAWTLAFVIAVASVPLAGLSEGAVPAIQATINGLVCLYIVGHVLGASGRADAWPWAGTWL